MNDLLGLFDLLEEEEKSEKKKPKKSANKKQGKTSKKEKNMRCRFIWERDIFGTFFLMKMKKSGLRIC